MFTSEYHRYGISSQYVRAGPTRPIHWHKSTGLVHGLCTFDRQATHSCHRVTFQDAGQAQGHRHEAGSEEEGRVVVETAPPADESTGNAGAEERAPSPPALPASSATAMPSPGEKKLRQAENEFDEWKLIAAKAHRAEKKEAAQLQLAERLYEAMEDAAVEQRVQAHEEAVAVWADRAVLQGEA